MYLHLLADDSSEFDKFERVSHPSPIMQSLKSFYDNQKMVDITILVGANKTKFKAHKLVLSAQSDVLEKMLTSPMKEAQENTIGLPKVDETAFRALVEFFYTGNVPVDKSLICQLIELCDHLHVLDLKQRCCTWLHENLVAEDACEYLMFSKKLSADEQLYKNCFQWIEDHAAEILCTESFSMHMTAEEVEKIAASDDLNLDEIQLFEGIEQWIEYDDSRHEDGKEIAKLLRLPMINVSDLLGCVKSSSFVESNAILEALMLLQQPTVYNPHEIDSSNFADLRMPSDRLPTSIMWNPYQPKLFTPGQAAYSNPAVIKSSGRLCTSKPLSIPSCVRVQLTTKSTINRNVTVGLSISCPHQDSRQPKLFIGPSPTHHKYGLECGVQLTGATLSPFPLQGTVLIPAGCIVALKFHVKFEQVCIHLNGTLIAKIPLTTPSCCSHLPQMRTNVILSQSGQVQLKTQNPNDSKKVFVEVVIKEVKDTAAISVKRERHTCCGNY